MIVVVPMMGLGSRFSKNGYSEYKPFVRINTVPLIKLVIEPLLRNFDKVYVVCDKETALQLRTMFDEQLRIIQLDNPTKGAADTLLQAAEHLPPNEQISCVDCDTIFSQQAIDVAKKSCGNFLLTFMDKDRTGLYSYVTMDKDGYIDYIAEKEAISEYANAGWYTFRSNGWLKYGCKAVVDLSTECYVSHAVGAAIVAGEKFGLVDVSGMFECCGTPAQLVRYSKEVTTTGFNKIICFDVDGTLVYDLLNNQRPIKKNVDYCNELYRNGHTIVLYSSRGMKSKGGDLQLVEQGRRLIEEVLKKCGVMYHALYLGKPFADLYIDDKAIPAHRNLEKECGIYLSEAHQARSHNKIVVNGDHVIKTGKLEGEAWWYNHIPYDISYLFPEVISASPTEIVLRKINKPTYSSLMLSRRLGKDDISRLVVDINTIHNLISDPPSIDFRWGYVNKLLERIKQYRDFYNFLNVDVDEAINLASNLTDFEVGIIHGDPVFTNIFDDGEHCKFIDMRGSWNGCNTVFGDIHYDYAKIYQSLLGYDYILHGEEIEYGYLEKLRNHFLGQISCDHAQLKVKTKLLFISLLPLHQDNIERCKKFYDLSTQTISA